MQKRRETKKTDTGCSGTHTNSPQNSLLNNQNGSMIIVALMTLVIMTVIGLISSQTVVTENFIIRNQGIYKINVNMVEAAIMEGFQLFMQRPANDPALVDVDSVANDYINDIRDPWAGTDWYRQDDSARVLVPATALDITTPQALIDRGEAVGGSLLVSFVGWETVVLNSEGGSASLVGGSTAGAIVRQGRILGEYASRDGGGRGQRLWHAAHGNRGCGGLSTPSKPRFRKIICGKQQQYIFIMKGRRTMKKNRSQINPFLSDAFGRFFVPALLALIFCVGIMPSTAAATCMDLNDFPLDTLQQEAPGIVMIVIDDSGSMDWEYICQGSADGKFRGSIEYVFADPGDNVYSSGDSNGTILEGSSYANYWESQCADYNRLYYDPSQTYDPWPTFEDAEWVGETRSNPSIAGITLDLDDTYDDLGGTSGVSKQDILDAGGVIVDNLEAQTAEDGLIIDNTGPVSPATGWFSTDGSSWGSSSNDMDYGSDYLYSNSSGQEDIGSWHYTNLEAGLYDVYVWYVSTSSRGTSINYTVYNDANVAVATHDFDQRNLEGGQWRLLASDVPLDGSALVQLRHDCTSTSTNRACADAVMLDPQFSGPASSVYTETGSWYESGASNEYEGSSRYTSTTGSTATWTPNLLTSGDYRVYVWYTTTGSRDGNAEYTVHDSTGDTIITPYIDQDQDAGQWVQLGDEFYFDAGTDGYVMIERHIGSTGGSTSADAMAFMPAVEVATLNLIRAHYYVVSGGDTYLVNLDGDPAYFRVDDQDGDGNVDGMSELESITADEAEAAGIGLVRSYAEERQNFANWYSFYRKRELTAKNAIGVMITSDDMQDKYIGLHFINNGTLASHALPVNVSLQADAVTLLEYDESSALLARLYSEQINSNGTPLRNGLKAAGRYFKGDFGKPGTFPGGFFSDSTYPYFTEVRGGSCQLSYAILMTDGYYNGGSPDVGNADANTANPFDGPPYADGVSNTLADVAMYYYKNDLNSTLSDFVPVTTLDQADHQHMVTYTLSFGVEGTIDQESDDYKDCITGGECLGSWPDPNSGNSQKIDDMFHAAVNGRGEYINAASPEEMVAALRTIGESIAAREKSSAALATNSIQRQAGSVLYQGTYNSGGWWGEIAALTIDSDGNVNTDVPKWRASVGVPANRDARNIISFDGSSSINFAYGALTTQQIALLGNNGHDVEDLVNYLRGTPVSGFRVRSNPIGDIVHSAPFYYKDVVYIGANDGMLHAVSAVTGEEVFCYVPNMVYDHLSDLALPGYSHKYYVDATASAAAVNGTDILVCGLGQGGKGYFGIDITSPYEPAALWEFTGDDDLGYTFSQANIIKTENEGRVVMFGNGYDSESETAALFFVDPEDGTLIAKLDTETTGCNGLSTPSAVDMDSDGYMDFVYAGDLHGNLWKFDIRGEKADWKIYYNGGSSQPLITVQNAAGDIQPITVAPEVMLDCAKSDFAGQGAGLMVIFATGRYLNVDDFNDDTVQSFYGVWDWGDIWENKDSYDVAKTKYMGQLNTDRSLPHVSTSVSLQEQTMTVIDGDWVMISNNPVNWYDPEENTGAHMGWFMDLSGIGERGVRDPQILKAGALELISITPSDSPCEAGGSSIIYRVSPCSGGFTDDPQFDVNGDGEIDDDDKTIDAADYFDSYADYNNDGVVDDEDLKAFLNYTDWNNDNVIDSNDLDAMKLPASGMQMEDMVFEGIDSGDQRYYSDTEGEINPVPQAPVILGMQYWRVIQ